MKSLNIVCSNTDQSDAFIPLLKRKYIPLLLTLYIKGSSGVFAKCYSASKIVKKGHNVGVTSKITPQEGSVEKQI